MRRIALFILTASVSIFSLLFLDGIKNYPHLLNFTILFICWGAIFEGLGYSLLLASLPVLVLLSLFVFTDWYLPLLFMAASFAFLPWVCFRLAAKYRRFLKNLNAQLNQARGTYEQLRREQQGIKSLNQGLEKQLFKLTNLYEATKQMSASLGFTEILKVLSDSLKEGFDFERALLFTFSWNNGIASVEEIYQMDKKGITEGGSILEGYGLELIKLLDERKQPLQVPCAGEDPYLSKSGLFKQDESVAAIPFMIDDKIRAILVAENLWKEDFERFFILGGQFSLELKRTSLYAKLQESAIFDGLTQVYVRRHFMERFEEELERSHRQGLKLSFLLLDIDRFKRQNDKFGHLVGDVVLKDVAALLKGNVREIDLVGRFGGEEFSVVLSDTDKENSVQAGERIRSAVAAHDFKAYGESLKVTISIGVATFPEDGQALGELVEKADEVLYKAKQTGRNRVCVSS